MQSNALHNAPPLPDEIIDRLIALDDQSSGLQWEMGDYICELTDELETFYAQYLGSPKEAHVWLVGHLAARSGIAKSTIRDREAVCRFFQDRQAISHLTFHQARALKAAGDKWPVYLAMVNAYMDDNGGRRPSVELIRRWIAEQGDDPLWSRRLAKVVPMLHQISADQEAPDKIRLAASMFLAGVE